MAVTGGGTRRERERLRHRAEILDAARKVVAARGLSGLTVEEVARQAEFAVGSIYRHFRSKDEMIELLVAHVAEPLCEEVEAIAASDAPFEEQLYETIRAVAEHFGEDLPLIQAFHAASGPIPAEGTEPGDRLRAMKVRCVDAVDRVLGNGQRDGVLPAGERRELTVALIGLVSGFVRWSAFGSAGPLDARVPPDRVAMICRLFLDGARAR